MQVPSCTGGIEELVVGARLNVMAMLKRLLDLPDSNTIKNRRAIISAVAPITARNKDNSTALHLAVAAGKVGIAHALLLFPEMDDLARNELSSAAHATDDGGQRAWLLAERAAFGGNTELVRLIARRAKDPQGKPRLLCAGLEAPSALFQGLCPTPKSVDLEAKAREVARPLLVTMPKEETCALRGVFECPPKRKAYFELEVVRAGETDQLSLGFATDQWDGQTVLDGNCSQWLGLVGRLWKEVVRDGDVVGLGVDRAGGQISINVNGKIEVIKLSTAQVELLLGGGKLFPAISGRATAVRVNWGGSLPFSAKIPDFPSVFSCAQHASGSIRSNRSSRKATEEQRRNAAQAAFDGDISLLRKLATLVDLEVNDPVPEINESFRGGRPHAPPYYLLHYACFKGHAETARMLVSELGANKEAADGWEERPLAWAAYGKQLATVKLMLELGAEVHYAQFYRQSSEMIAAAIETAMRREAAGDRH